jgi:hypothetical protein
MYCECGTYIHVHFDNMDCVICPDCGRMWKTYCEEDWDNYWFMRDGLAHTARAYTIQEQTNAETQ